MNSEIYILVGAKEMASNPGGIGSVSIGFQEYACSQGYALKIIDTAQSSFPVQPLRTRAKKSILRIFSLFQLLSFQKVKGVVIFSSSGFSFYERSLMAGICRLYRVRSVFFMLSGDFLSSPRVNFFIKFIAMFLLKLPHVIGLQGDAWRPFYRKLGVNQKKLITIKNWASSSFIQASEPMCISSDTVINFCFVGWLVEAKGVIELLSAIINLASDYQFKFTFVGGGTLLPYLQEKINENKLNDRVRLTGWVAPEVVKTILQESHVFVLPSKAEGFPIALLEAMSVGLPAICTNVGAISDLLCNDLNGFLLKDGGSDSIMAAMEKYLNDSELVNLHSIEALNLVLREHNRDKNCGLLFEQFQ